MCMCVCVSMGMYMYIHINKFNAQPARVVGTGWHVQPVKEGGHSSLSSASLSVMLPSLCLAGDPTLNPVRNMHPYL